MSANLWLSWAFLTASILATLTLLDKVVLDKEFTNSVRATTLNGIPMFLIYVLVGVGTGSVGLESGAVSSDRLVAISLSTSLGVLFVVSLETYYRGLATTEVSRFVPILSTDIVFIVILAFVFLQESFSAIVYVGLFAVFFGSVLISIEDPSSGIQFVSRTAISLALVSALAAAIVSIVLKYVAGELSMFGILLWMGVGGLGSLGVIVGIRFVRDQATVEPRTLLDEFSSGDLFLAISGVFSGLSYFTFLKALETGPVSLASAILKLNILMVFFGVVVLTYLTPEVLYEKMEWTDIAQKLVASTFVVAGVVIFQFAST